MSLNKSIALSSAWRSVLAQFRSRSPMGWALRCGLAIGLVLAGWGLRQAVTRWVGPGLPTFVTYYPAVMVAALLGGFGPGLVATLLTEFLVAYWVLPPVGQLAVDSPVDRVSLVLFGFMGVFMSGIAGLYRRHRKAAAAYEREAALRESREVLRRQAELIDPVRAEVIAQEMQRVVRERSAGADSKPPALNTPGAVTFATWGVRIAGTLTALTGVVFLGVWLAGIGNEFATRNIVIPKTNLALALVLSGTALLLLGRERGGRLRRRSGAVLSAGALLIGALTLSEHFLGWNLGIDQLLATEIPGVARTASPNRMGPPASLSLTLLGLGLLTLARKRRVIAPYLGLAACVINIVPAVGFLYGVERFYSQPQLTGISWMAVVALISLGAGLVLAVRETGPTTLLLRADAGGTLLRRMLPAVILIPLAMGFLKTQGQALGFYDIALGTGLLVIVVTLLFALFLWLSAARLSQQTAAARRAETAVRNQAELMDHAHEALIVRELDGVIRSWNRGAEGLYGWSAAEALGQSIHVLLGTAVTSVREIQTALEQTGHWEGELAHTARDGRRITVESRKTATRTEDGRVLVLESNRDITARRRAEQAERESLERVRQVNAELQAANAALAESRAAAINLMDDAVLACAQAKQAGEALLASEQRMQQALRVSRSFTFEWQPATDRVIRSSSCAEILNLSSEEAVNDTGQNFFQRVHPDDRARFVQMFGRLSPSASDYATEYRVVRGDGRVVVLEEVGQASFDAGGKLERLVGVSTDITARTQAEAALRRSERRYRSFIEVTSQWAWVTDANGQVVEDIPALRGFTGQSDEQARGAGWAAALHPDDASHTLEVWNRAVATRTPYEVEYRLRRHDGVYRLMLARGVPIFDEGGGVEEWVGTCLDITDRKEVEAAMREVAAREKIAEAVAAERQRFNNVLDLLPAYVILLAPDYHVPFANRFFEQRFGKASGKRCYEYLFHRTEPCENCETFKVLQTHAPHHWEWTGPDGRDYDVHDFPFTDADGAQLIMEMGIDITERKRAEAALKQINETLEQRVSQRTAELAASEEQFRRALEDAPIPVIMHAEDGQVLQISRAWTELTGYRREDMGTFESWLNHAYGEGADALRSHVKELFRGARESLDLDIPIRTRGGQTRHWSFSASAPGKLADGRRFLVGMALDITERKLAEEALRASEARYRELIEVSPDAVLVLREDCVVFANPAATRLLGVDAPEALLGRNLFDLLAPESRTLTGELLWLVEEGLKTVLPQHAVCFVRPDGQLVEAEAVGAEINFAGTTAIQYILRDLTERIRIQRALRESESFYRQTLESIPGMVFTTRPDGYCDYQSQQWVEFTGVPMSEHLGDGWNKLLHPDDRPRAFAAWHAAVEGRAPYDLEYRVRRHDGAYEWFKVQARPIRNAAGEIVRWFGTALNVDALVKAQQALRQNQEDLDRAQEVGQIGSWRLDLRRNVLTWSDETHRIFGVPKGTPLTYETFLSRIHPDDRQYVDTKWQAGLREGTYDVEHRIVADAQIKWVREKAFLELDEAGALSGGFGIAQDITARRQAEERLKDSLREKEVLLKEIHHRVKNNLQVIASLINLQADTLNQPGLRESFMEVRDRVRTMALVHEKLYQSGDLAQLNLAEYAASLLQYLWRAHGAAAAHVRLALEAEPVTLPVDTAVPCGLILNELASNALKHAFPNQAAGEVKVGVSLDASAQQVCLRVRDNGAGLPPNLDWRESRSLGLRLVQMLTQQIRGTVEAGPGPGAEFRIVFPLPQKPG